MTIFHCILIEKKKLPVWAILIPQIKICANLCSCKICNNKRQAALAIHIVNQHNVCVRMCVHTHA